MYIRTKNKHGKPRQALVKSVRDKGTGDNIQEHIAYVDDWPEKQITRLKSLRRQYEVAIENKNKEDATVFYIQKAREEVGRLITEIDKLKRNMRMKLKVQRARFDRRRKSSEIKEWGHPRNGDPIDELTTRLNSLDDRICHVLKKSPLARWPLFQVEYIIRLTDNLMALRRDAKRVLRRRESIKTTPSS